MPATPPRRTVPAERAQTQDTLESASEMRLYPSEPALSQSWETNAPQSQHSATATRAPLPPQVAAQLIEVVRQMPNRPVDIALSPEELGRVRLSITTHETGVMVNVLAERPETLDLLRRHIDQLGQEFRDLGFADIAFSFAAGDQAAGGSDPRDKPPGQHESPASPLLTEPDTASALPPLAAGALTGLDLRL
ncbi:flagellar hook-length control protein FliK [Sulfitobacter sp. PS-8MA]|uniref:flagellar hook-length control protein FliK n=1 Tax=Sulfitobacter sp. PS-8MA TaxID=3237707 RepID=UPI0034C63549